MTTGIRAVPEIADRAHREFLRQLKQRLLEVSTQAAAAPTSEQYLALQAEIRELRERIEKLEQEEADNPNPPAEGETPVDVTSASVMAFEALNSGSFVNVFLDGGTAKARKASASAGYRANGFVLSAAVAGAMAKVYSVGINKSLGGLVAGTRYYLSATAGLATATPVTQPNMDQFLGTAISATALAFVPYEDVELAVP